ncbi:hypothetical protein EKO23_19590 [Nocardioides guangzhouensis]|uniref:Uncharacterized protein n=1 Tax=Nocardioides guangzhouensis TaxID=2497878 RepID=A0A4Q4Z852_9ACTN|nr:hypothetical protein [Nocardioides guangzhouensis]RYP83266.1 hypothetical protein EKO23_19590 [Nocardioides guangzhouensis]
MNTTNTRHTTAILATATAVAAALTVTAPTAASAKRPDSVAGPATQRVVSARVLDIDEHVAYRRALMAQYYVDHARELQQWAVR